MGLFCCCSVSLDLFDFAFMLWFCLLHQLIVGGGIHFFVVVVVFSRDGNGFDVSVLGTL